MEQTRRREKLINFFNALVCLFVSGIAILALAENACGVTSDLRAYLSPQYKAVYPMDASDILTATPCFASEEGGPVVVEAKPEVEAIVSAWSGVQPAVPVVAEEGTCSWLRRRFIFHAGLQVDADLWPSAKESWNPKNASIAHPKRRHGLKHPLTVCTAKKLARFFLHQEFDPLVFDDSCSFARSCPQLHRDTQTLYGAVLFNDSALIVDVVESLNVQAEILIASQSSTGIAREALYAHAHPFTIAIIFLLPLPAANYTHAHGIIENASLYNLRFSTSVHKALLYLASLRDSAKSAEPIEEDAWMELVPPSQTWNIRNILGHYVVRSKALHSDTGMQMTHKTMAMQVLAACESISAAIKESSRTAFCAKTVSNTLGSMFAADDMHAMTPSSDIESQSSLSSALVLPGRNSESTAKYVDMILGEFGLKQWIISQDNRQFVCSAEVGFSDIYKSIQSNRTQYLYAQALPNYPDLLAFQTTVNASMEVESRDIASNICLDGRNYMLRAVITAYRNQRAVIVYNASTCIWTLLTADGAFDVPAYLAHTYIASKATECFFYERI